MTNLSNPLAAVATRYRYKSSFISGNETISYNVPETTFLLPDLPQRPTGKTERQLLKRLFLELIEATGETGFGRGLARTKNHQPR